MSFNINQFQAEMTKNGIAKTSDFEVEITGYPGDNGGGSFSLGGILDDITKRIGNEISTAAGFGNVFDSSSSSAIARSLSFRIDTITMPQRSVNMINYQTYGAPYKIGGNLNYVDIDFSVILSPDLREREFFLKWQDLIGGDHRTGTTNWDIGYYDNYICKKGFTIYQLDPNGNRTRKIELIDSYPLMVGSINGNWATTDVQKINITMAFRYFEEEEIPIPLLNLSSPDNILSAAKALKNLPNQIKNRSGDALSRGGIPVRLF
jgi:hypothetical protein